MIDVRASPLPVPYVEDVRFEWERTLQRVLSLHPRGADSHEESEPAAMLLSESSAQRVYGIARHVAGVLGCHDPFVVLQTRSMDHLNAQAQTHDGKLAVRLIGPVVSLLDDGALAAMIGHEFGHLLAHLSRPEDRLFFMHPVRLAGSVARELTADRFGVLGCQDLEALVRIEVSLATGVSTVALGLRELEHLAEVRERIEASRSPLTDMTHPTHDFRLYAAWLFWRSDVYRRLTGDAASPGDLQLAEVDAKLESMLTTPTLTDAIAEMEREAEERSKRRRKKRPTTQSVEHEPPAPPAAAEREAPTNLADRVLSGARAALGMLAKERASSAEPANAQSVEPTAGELPVVGVDPDLEQRFRELEARADGGDRERIAELERRFEELEKN